MKRDYKDHPEAKHDPFRGWTIADIMELVGAGLLFVMLYFLLTIVFCF